MKRQIRKVGVLGSGVMGMGISAHLAGAGLEVVMLDIVPPELSGEDQKKGITVDNPDFRNRFAAGALARALKENPQTGPFFHPDDAELIRVGNFEDHAHLLKECDWIIEVVVENLKIKQEVMKMVAKNWNRQAIISTNTSGIPLREIAGKMKPEMKKVFLGTHFFNPVRFMHLLEVIPFKETDKKVVSFIADFCENRLGKGIVYGKDTPNFVANRIGVAGMIGTINLMQELGMKIDETDQIFGTPLGRPKSALFRTADMVGLDTLVHIAHNTSQYVKPDEAKKYFTLPRWIEGMVDKKLLGNKTGSGFYKRLDRKTIKVIDPETLEYVDQSGEKFESLKLAGFTADVGERIKGVLKGEGRESKLAKRAIYDQLIYAAERVGEICDSVVEIDNGMKWGFNFDIGPFEAWDGLGFKESVADMEDQGCKIPKRIKDMKAARVKSFYKEKAGKRYYYDFKKKDYLPVAESDAVINLADLKKDPKRIVDSRKTASIIDIGDGVYCVEFHSVMNALEQDMWEMMRKAVDIATEKGVGVVIGNQAPGMPGAFSAGANIGTILEGARSKQWDMIRNAVQYFQETNTYMTYSPVPVVAAPYGMTLGGGAEVSMSCNKMVCHHDLFIGLVELGVGVIPGGGGCMLMLRHYQNFVPKNAAANNLQPFVAPILQLLGTARVSTSAANGRDLGFVRPGDRIAFNKRQLIGLAKQEVLAMAELGFVPPRPQKYQVMGDQLRGIANVFVRDMVLGGYATEYDAFILKKLAHILGGGYVSENSVVSEDYLLELEREAFVELCAEEKTQARLEHMLTTGRPLRN